MTIAEAKQEKASNSAALAITPTDNLSYFLKYSGDNLDAFPQKAAKGSVAAHLRGMRPALTERKGTQCLEETQTFIRL